MWFSADVTQTMIIVCGSSDIMGYELYNDGHFHVCDYNYHASASVTTTTSRWQSEQHVDYYKRQRTKKMCRIEIRKKIHKYTFRCLDKYGTICLFDV